MYLSTDTNGYKEKYRQISDTDDIPRKPSSSVQSGHTLYNLIMVCIQVKHTANTRELETISTDEYRGKKSGLLDLHFRLKTQKQPCQTICKCP